MEAKKKTSSLGLMVAVAVLLATISVLPTAFGSHFLVDVKVDLPFETNGITRKLLQRNNCGPCVNGTFCPSRCSCLVTPTRLCFGNCC
ncbi:hypothetical protein L484_008291 [Morus notabilis]|uniref:Uncharacterized protein n=1 Tax=Morus notabilis TaxID=981085 RepID=W9RAW7_9ROSA|nr:hypothetical protein L484_008291 [Morus notabilis]